MSSKPRAALGLDDLNVKVAYYCVYCGAPMYHRGKLQPSISYARCWECWGKDVIGERDAARQFSKEMTHLALAGWLIALAAVTYIVGWWG